MLGPTTSIDTCLHIVALYHTGDKVYVCMYVCTYVAARAEAWEGKNLGSVRRLLADPRWEKRFVRFLELSGVGRTLADGTDEESAYAARMDTWIAWETEDVVEVERSTPRGDG
jgi:hypothetical protein